ncbi:MAG: DUF3298 domain-containing protein [Lachnoclostridium sp.]|jgi:hypothetical protein
MDANIENKLKKYQKEYEKITMSDDAYQAMIARMKDGKEAKYRLEKRKKSYKCLIAGLVTAAVLALVILPNTSGTAAHAMENIPLVGKFFKVITFRDYQYEDEKNVADVKVPEITMKVPKGNADNHVNNTAAETAKDTTAEINAEIRNLTDQWIEKFKANMEDDGYKNITIKSEVINTSKDYFTLKLICFQAAGSGYEENHFYTINLKTGERVKLADLFQEGSDYKGVISENIKTQMKEQMANDPNVIYWVDNEEYPQWNFKEITDDTSFYINADNEIVICFNEGDVAPAYMGTVEFVIPNDVVADILK